MRTITELLKHHVAFENADQRAVEPLHYWIDMLGADSCGPLIDGLQREGFYAERSFLTDEAFRYDLTNDPVGSVEKEIAA